MASLSILGAFLLNLTGYFEDFELSTLRARVRAKGPDYPGAEIPGAKVPGIAIIAIDDRSLLPPEDEGLGRFYDWTREYYAQVLDLLGPAEPAAIVFDIHFFEPAGNPDYPRLSREVLEESQDVDEIREWLELHDEDRLFAEAIRRADNVVLGLAAIDYSNIDQLRDLTSHPYERFALRLDRETRRNFYEYAGYHPPLPELTEAARLLGHTTMHPQDEIIWRVPLALIAPGERLGDLPAFPSLSLAAIAAVNDVPLEQISFDPEVGFHLGAGLTIPTTPRGELILNYVGPPGLGMEGSFTYYSFTDIQYTAIRDDMTPEEKTAQLRDNFNDTVVIIGGTAGALFDFVSTPYSNAHPGVEIHATAIHNILSGNYLRRLDPLVSLGIFIGLSLLVCFAVAHLRWWLATPLVLLLFLGYVLLAFNLFESRNLWLELVRPGSGMILGMLVVIAFNYVVEQRAKSKIKQTFSLYVSPAVVEEMIDNPNLVRLGGEKKDLSVIFTDVKGFTTISEQMEPGELVELMNDYLTPMADVVFANRGTVDKFIGDAVMGIFGAPVPLDHHADAACHTALEMLQRLDELNAQWADLNRPAMSMRIGINSGPMVVGNMGSHTRFDYTVMGDNVNLGARLEPLNTFFNTSVIISEYTRSRLRDDFLLRELGNFRVKGKTEPVICYELLGLGREREALVELLGRFDEALEMWKQADFAGAFKAFTALSQDFPEDGPSRSYLVQTRSLYANPPGDDWEPIHVMLAK